MAPVVIQEFINEELRPKLDGINYSSHRREVDLIDSLANLSFNPVKKAGGRIRVKTYRLHGTPYIDYTLPNGVNIRKEIADVLFDTVAKLPGGEQRRRGFLAQAKFDKDGSSWEVDTSQFRFIHHLPVFIFTSPKTAHSFNLEPKYTPDEDHEYTGNTLAVGLFGSKGEKPFFLRTERILEGIPNVEGGLDLRYQRSAYDDAEEESFTISEFGGPAGYDYINSVLGSFLQGRYGRRVVEKSELERFMNHMEEIATSSSYSHLHNKSLCTDGGEQQDSGFIYMKFEIDLRDAELTDVESVL